MAPLELPPGAARAPRGAARGPATPPPRRAGGGIERRGGAGGGAAVGGGPLPGAGGVARSGGGGVGGARCLRICGHLLVVFEESFVANGFLCGHLPTVLCLWSIFLADRVFSGLPTRRFLGCLDSFRFDQGWPRIICQDLASSGLAFCYSEGFSTHTTGGGFPFGPIGKEPATQ